MNTSIAWIDDVHLINVTFNDVIPFSNHIMSPHILWKRKNKSFKTDIIHITHERSLHLNVHETLPMGENLLLIWGVIEIPVYPGAIVRTQWFDQHYSATDAKLGAIHHKDATLFAIWAPTAISVTLNLDKQAIELTRVKKGLWQKKVSGDWHGYAYNYEINVNGKHVLANDPYGKAMLANSYKSVVIGLGITDPTGFQQINRPYLDDLQDAIIYELHVRDATMQKESGTINRGKYLGLTEKNTLTENGNSSGLSYIKELGVTHIQLLPINDFARVDESDPAKDYNWGYDPLFFQVPEGSYATSVDDPVIRIKESKQMIQSFHDEGLAVILDVVYNHVYIIEESAFELIVPGYYFRYHPNGVISDGTGVGNDFASERLMGRKFILDTVDYWLNEYRVDGFRFDLMGVMDVETMRLIHERCQRETEPIMLLGEGWDLATALPTHHKATSTNSHQLPGIRYFNDFFRDSVKGNLFDIGDRGFVNGHGRHRERLASLISGSALPELGRTIVSDVTQSVNFVECHDNFTLWDQLALTNPNTSETARRKMHQIATGITLLSQGVPFIHAGQEWFQTKQGDGNSYLSGDAINQLDWNKRDSETETIAFVKALIALRSEYDVFRLRTKQEIRDRVYVLDTPFPTFGFTLLGDDEDIAIYLNPTPAACEVQLPSPGLWEIAVTNDSLSTHEIIGEFVEIRAFEFIVMLKTRV